MSGSEFASDTALRRAGVGGRWAAEIRPRWNVGTKPNGGYLLAIATRAMLAEADRPDPLSITAHFLSSPDPGPARIDVTVVKPGRSLVNVSASLVQGERERVRALGVFGDLPARSGPSRVSAGPPALPPPERCVPLAELTTAAGRWVPESLRRYELRVAPDSPWGRPGDGDPFEIAGWIRFADGTDPSVESLVAFADAFPPTLLGAVTAGWVPTLELTVHVRARPAPGWLLGVFRTRFLLDGLLEEDGELWDGTGRPVALSRQLATVLPPAHAARDHMV